MPFGCRSRNADDRHTARALPLCRDPLVLDHLWPRWAHHRASNAVVEPRRSAAACCSASPPIRPRRPIRLPTPNPGKILHEMRGGEMAALREVPFGLYYGSVDSTPLFVLLAGLYLERTGDIDTIATLWPSIEAALDWIDGPGDPDGDGFVEYVRASEHGLANQGWKDSHDAIFHADGRLAEGAIALAEVQSYVYAAKRLAARCARRHRARRHGAEARRRSGGARRALRGRLLVPGDRHLRTGSRRRQKTVRRAHVECGPSLVHRHRCAAAGRARRQGIAAAGLLLGLGNPHGGARRSALQSDVVS